MTLVLSFALVLTSLGLLQQRREIKQLEAEHTRLCELLQEDRP